MIFNKPEHKWATKATCRLLIINSMMLCFMVGFFLVPITASGVSSVPNLEGEWQINYNVFPYSVSLIARCVDCDTGEVCQEAIYPLDFPGSSMNLTCNVSQEGYQLLGDCPGTEYSLSGSVAGNSVVFTLSMLVDQYLGDYPCNPSPMEHVFTGILNGNTIEGTMAGGLYLECPDPDGCQPDDGRGRRCGPSLCTSYSDSEWNGTFTVNIPPPVAKIRVRKDGRMVWFDGSDSYDPDGGEIQRYIWDFGGGNIQEGKRIGIWYTETGFYTIKLTVVDDEGQTGSTEIQLPVVVVNDALRPLRLDLTKEKARGIAAGLAKLRVVTLSFGVLGRISNTVFLMYLAKAIPLGTVDAVAIAAFVVIEGVVQVIEWIGHTVEREMDAYDKLADDPPDSNYREIAEIETFETFPPEGETSTEVAIIELMNCMSENQAILEALTTSIERFQGAVIANEDQYILLQARAIADYSGMTVDNLEKLDICFDKLVLEIQAIQSDPQVPVDLGELQYRLATEGFTEEEIRYFKDDLGASDSEIEAYKQMLLDFDISAFRAEIEKLQKALDEGVPAYSDLADQASHIVEMYNDALPTEIEFIYIPAFGSHDNLRGTVTGVNPGNYKVAVYIYVPPYGWWTKPYSNQPLTSIASNGTWTCDITTGGSDSCATKIIAFLVPDGYGPPEGAGQQCLDSELYQYPYAEATRYEKISFAGYNWLVKRSCEPVGPGANYFSDEEENVWVDPNGYLHMGIVQRNGDWYCSEVIADANLGYGTYIFTVQGRVDLLDENIILGLFTWEDCIPQYNYREIDIELSKWGNPVNDNAQFVVQPWDTVGNRHRFNIDLAGYSHQTTTHEFTWQPDGIYFQSYYGDFSLAPASEDIITSWYYTGDDIPPAGAENPRINFWLMNGNAPVDGQDAEIVIKSFLNTEPLTVTINKCNVRAGKKEFQDSIKVSGLFTATMNHVKNASEIYVKIWSDSDNYNVHSESFSFNPANVVSGKYTYIRRLVKGQQGAISRFSFDLNKQTFTLEGKYLDLTGLGCPLSIEIEIGDYYGIGQANEQIVNGTRQPIPIQLMTGYEDTLRVDKIKVKSGRRGDSLSVKGAFALKNKPSSIGDVIITWDSQAFTIPGSQFYSKRNTESCKNVELGNGIASAKFDPVKCSFIITIKNADIESISGEVDFGISMYGSFSENVEVDLD